MLFRNYRNHFNKLIQFFFHDDVHRREKNMTTDGYRQVHRSITIIDKSFMKGIFLLQARICLMFKQEYRHVDQYYLNCFSR